MPKTEENPEKKAKSSRTHHWYKPSNKEIDKNWSNYMYPFHSLLFEKGFDNGKHSAKYGRFVYHMKTFKPQWKCILKTITYITGLL